jgi:hypothetical protein
MTDLPARPLTPVDIARDYTNRGYAVVPVPFRQKGPIIEDWQKLRITAEQVARYFGRQTNIGVILGQVSRGRVDVDLDCNEAIKLAPQYLPSTRSKFGRATGRSRTGATNAMGLRRRSSLSIRSPTRR